MATRFAGRDLGLTKIATIKGNFMLEQRREMGFQLHVACLFARVGS
jgi:hypothetical protein